MVVRVVIRIRLLSLDVDEMQVCRRTNKNANGEGGGGGNFPVKDGEGARGSPEQMKKNSMPGEGILLAAVNIIVINSLSKHTRGRSFFLHAVLHLHFPAPTPQNPYGNFLV